MLITCPECSRSISDQAFACPGCGYPIQMKQASVAGYRRARGIRHKLPNGTGSIKRLTGKRTRPYAAYPPTTEFDLNGSPVPVPAIGYYPDWKSAMSALIEYNKNPYDLTSANLTFREVYEMYFKEKYISNQKKKLSASAANSTRAAFRNCAALHGQKFRSIRKSDMQAVVDACPLKHASLELIVTLFRQMYRFAIQNDIVDKDYSQFVTINKVDDDESGEPFAQEELDILWAHKDMEHVSTILIMIYSGYRIKALESLAIHLEEGYFQGGIKTTAGKNRIVPIHDAIVPFAKKFMPSKFRASSFRNNHFYPLLEQLGIARTVNGKRHTPHDCRHTFSWLCDHYGVDDFSKHLLMGHSLGNDVEKAVYGHRTLEELRTEISKIRI